MKFISNLNILKKIIVIVSIMYILALIIAQFSIKPKFVDKIYEQRKTAIKLLVEEAISVVQANYKKFKAGGCNEEKAKQETIKKLKQLRYDNGTGYFWINDFSPKMVMHPTKPQLDGKNLANITDSNGKKLFVEIVKIVKKDGEGFVTYQWEKPGSEVSVNKMSYVIGFKPWKWIIGSGTYVKDIEAEINDIYLSMAWILVIFTVGIFVLTYLLAKNISQPIQQLMNASTKVANGDVNVSVKLNRTDEIGKLATSFNKMTENLKTLLQEVKQKGDIAEKAASEASDAKQKAVENEEYLSKHVKLLLNAMEKLANGDLSVKATAERSDDDIAKLFNGFNTTVTNLRNIINQVKKAVEATASASTEISSSAEEMAAGAQKQSSQTSEVATAMEEMSRTVVETAGNATAAADASRLASEKANDGAEKLSASKEGMQQIVEATDTVGTNIASLASKTEQIGEIAQVIDDIADQTNLLALNAAIEAARAGEQGRGFAVVADEVRKLAERTTKATKEIAETIKAIQVEANDANSSMEEAGAAVKSGMELNEEVSVVLTDILNSVEGVSQQINQVAATSEEQSATAEQVASNIESINNVANESATVVQQIATASEDLNRLTENLSEIIEQFRLDDNSKYEQRRLLE